MAVRALFRWSMLVALVGVASAAGGCAKAEPSQAQLISLFKSHRSDFNRLRQVVNERPRIYDVYDYGKTFTGVGEHGSIGPMEPSEARISEVRRLMRSTGADTLINGGDYLTLQWWCECDFSHLGPGHPSKGIAFRAHPPGRLVRSIEDPYGRPRPHEGVIYSKIEGGWYVWYNYST